MPLSKSAREITAPRKVLLSSNGLSELTRVHRDAVLRELARGTITAEAWIDYRGRLQPLFSPDVAIQLARLVQPSHPEIPPVIT